MTKCKPENWLLETYIKVTAWRLQISKEDALQSKPETEGGSNANQNRSSLLGNMTPRIVGNGCGIFTAIGTNEKTISYLSIVFLHSSDHYGN